MGHCVVGLALSQNIMGYMEWSLCERCPGDKSIPPSRVIGLAWDTASRGISWYCSRCEIPRDVLLSGDSTLTGAPRRR